MATKEEKKKIIAGAGILSGIGLFFLFLKRGHAAPPPPPPDKSTLYGKVTDAQTGKAIQDIEISMGGYSGLTAADGYYVIENIVPGEYAVTFQDSLGRYEPVTL